MLRLCLVVILAFINCVSAFALPKPDLRPFLRVTGPTIVDRATGQLRVPVRVTVSNAGDDIAGRFKFDIQFSHSSFAGTRSTVFTTFSSSDRAFTSDGRYVWTSKALFPGQSYSFIGIVKIPSGLTSGSTLYLRINADSCAGEEFMPVYCHVDESNETNNQTDLLSTLVP